MSPVPVLTNLGSFFPSRSSLRVEVGRPCPCVNSLVWSMCDLVTICLIFRCKPGDLQPPALRLGNTICDTVISNKNHIFDLCPCFWHRAPKTLGISYKMRERKKGVFCYVNNKTFSLYQRMGLVARRTNHVIRWLTFFSPIP